MKHGILKKREQVLPVIVENRPTKSLNKPFKIRELLAVVKKFENLKNLKKKKAEGLDSIAKDMIKYFPDKILNVILDMYNGFWSRVVFLKIGVKVS